MDLGFAALIVGVIAVVGAPVALGAAGLPAAGLAAASGMSAAGGMSAATLEVAAGGLVATLQKIAGSYAAMKPAAAFADEGVSGYQVAGFPVLMVGGAVVAVVGDPVVLGAAGFTSAGIAAGSIAASMMSAAAAANGGGVAAGGLVAGCQAAGAAGSYAIRMPADGGGMSGYKAVGFAVLIVGGAVVAVFLVPVALRAAGSYAASMMLVTAVANGGRVAAGGLFARQ